MGRYEVRVVGGGAWGIAIAFNLALLGKKRVFVLERNAVGSGATGRASGIIRQHYDDASLAKMALDSLRLFRDSGSYAGVKSEFSNTGYLVASADAEKLAAKSKSLRTLGINTRLVEPS